MEITREQFKAYAEGKNMENVPERMITEPMRNGARFNIFAGLFGGFYFIYRRMYLAGILLGLASIVLALIPLIGAVGIWLMFGFSFYPLYRGRVEKIALEAKYRNADVTASLRQAGGPSLIALWVAIGVVIAICVLLTFVLLYGI